MADISENLFQAIDILTAKRLEGLKYDKTLLCEILDDTKAERGEYKVSDGSSIFTAYSDVTTYKNGISVYVTIPEGDYSQRKIITGKYVQDGGEYYTYIAPFDSYLDITNNFIKTDNKEYSLLANGAENEITVFEWHREDSDVIPKEYSRMGLKADFRTWLGYLEPVTGSYGLRIDIVSREVQNVISDEESHKNYSYYLDSSDFYGDIYNFETYYQQEVVFDISMITEIQDLKITFYQSNNFYDITKTKIPTTDGGELLDDNIFLHNTYLSFGFDASQFIEDEVFLYTLDGETYDVSGANVKDKNGVVYNKNKKLLQARWVHFVSKGHAIMIDGTEDFNTSEATLHWYKYKQEDGVYDELAGDLWEEIPNTLNTFALEVTPDITKQNEYYKLIIECPNETYVEENARLQIANLGDEAEYGIYDENGIIVKRGSLHDQIEDLEKEIKNLENDIDKVGNRVLLNYKQQQLSSMYTSLNGYINSVVQIWKEFNAMRKLYYSKVLTLTNETLVPASSNLELVDGLNIIVDQGGLKGNYAIYGMTNEILKSTEAMKSRTLEAVYKSIITHDDALNKASSICWKIPADGTMIAEPVLGTDYMYESYAKANNLTSNYKDIDYIQTSMEDNGVTIPLVNLTTGELIPYQGFYWLIRQGTEIYHDERPNADTTALQISVQQSYKIKKYYQQSSKNNTVHCLVTKNGFTYSAQATMTFGLHGTNGTDNTLLLQLRRYKKEGGKVVPMELVSAVYPGAKDIMIEARLFDYNNEEVQIKSVQWSMHSKGESSSLYVATGDSSLNYTRTQKVSSVDQFGLLKEEDQEITIYAIPVYSGALKADLSSFMHNIVKAQVSYGKCTVGATSTGAVDFTDVDDKGIPKPTSVTPKERSVSLTAYLPIPFASSTNLTWAEIPTQIVYDASGSQPSYYKDTIKICGKDGNYAQITNCEVKHTDEAKNNAYYPTIKVTELNTTGQGVQIKNYSLKPLNMFLNGLKTQVSIVCTVGSLGTWIQPLLIIQNRWPSAVLNEWDGSLTIDEKNGTILSTMVGAGKKETDNSFTGVLMGDIATGADINTSQTGVYGFHHGVQSFGLKDDGSAFFGKAGKGQILFNGDSGVIQSMSYSIDGGTGMKIDLDDGFIEMKGANGEAGENTESKKKVYKASGSLIRLDVAGGENKPYLQIKTASSDDPLEKGESRELMYVGIKKYHLQTADYTKPDNDADIETGKNGKGMKIDLHNGYIEGYNFALRGYDNGENNNGIYAGSYFTLNSNGNPYFRIHYKKSDGTTVQQEGLNLVEISTKNFYLQSQDFNDNKNNGVPLAGIKLDMGTDNKPGKLKGYNFSLEAINTLMDGNSQGKHYGSYLLINSDGEPYFRIHYKDSKGTSLQQDGLNLIEISNDDFYIQSQDFNDNPNNGVPLAGVKLQLSGDETYIKGYDFSFEAINPEGRYKGSYLLMNSDGEPYFRVHFIDNEGTEKQKGGLNLVEITNNNFYIQSQDFYESYEVGKSRGVYFNLANEAFLKGYNFTLIGEVGDGDYAGSYYKLSSDVKNNPYLQVFYRNSKGTSKQQYGLDLIKISPTEYIIQSQNFYDEAQICSGDNKGLHFDLVNGILKGYNFTLMGETSGGDYAGSYFKLSNGENENPFLQVHFKYNEGTDKQKNEGVDLIYISPRQFFIQSQDFYNESYDPAQGLNKGIRLDLAEGRLQGYNFTLIGENSEGSRAGSYFKLSSIGTYSDPFLQIRYRDSDGENPVLTGEGLDLIHIDSQEFFMQSQNFYEDGNIEYGINTGIHFNLSEGFLKGYNFSLMGINSGNTYRGSYFTLNSEGSYDKPFFKIFYKKNTQDATEAQRNGLELINITSDEFIMRSQNWNPGYDGTEIDLKNGLITSYNFHLLSTNADNSSRIEISNDGNTSPYLYIRGSDSQGNSNDLIYISKNSYFLQSLDTTLTIDLKNNIIRATKNFEISAYKSESEWDKFITINSGAESCPLMIGNQFQVAWDGTVIATNIQASQGGTIGPFTISSDSLYTNLGYQAANSVYLGTSGISIHNVFYVDSNGYLYAAGGALFGGDVSITGNCSVSGSITDGGGVYYLDDGTSTQIAGWNITSSAISKNNITINSGGYIKAGNNTTYCQMNEDGSFYANSATIEGTITSGDGEIGGWIINSGSISKDSIILSASGGYILAGDETGSKYCKINNEGLLKARNAEIEGKIEANNGTIGGWNISSSWLTSSGGGITLCGGLDYTGDGTNDISPYIRVNQGGEIEISGTGILTVGDYFQLYAITSCPGANETSSAVRVKGKGPDGEKFYQGITKSLYVVRRVGFGTDGILSLGQTGYELHFVQGILVGYSSDQKSDAEQYD